MNEYNNTLTLTQKEIENNPFYDKDHHAAFYRMIVPKICGRAYDDIDNIDCRKLIIAPDIQDSWYRNRPNDVDSVTLTMGLAISGPKVDHSLKPGEVRWTDDCVTLKETDHEQV